MRRSEHEIGGEVGRGRSGVVFYDRDDAGRAVVEKVFGGDTASKVVLYVLTGAPNPYIWNADAIACTVARRRILAHLVAHWFGDRLRLPRTDGSAWHEDRLAYALRCEFIDGGHAPLRLVRPRDTQADAITNLRRTIMRPLQRHLRDAGFDGLVWQAGLGNPVAANNFMLASGSSDADDPRWVWIDLESDVPALFPANPLALLRFYLPKSFHHGRPLFDDVDTARLAAYLTEHREALAASLGSETLDEIDAAVADLETHQRGWKTPGRLARSIEAARVRRRITDEQAEHYRSRPVRWLTRLGVGAVGSVFRGVGRRIARFGRYVASIRWAMLLRSTFLFCTSQRFRTRFARRYVVRRVGLYELRGQMDRTLAHDLRHELRGDASAEYITDFGVHLAIKPFMKSLQWVGVPALLGAGVVGPFTAAAILAVGGAVGRTAYTLGRTIQASIRREPLPLVALFVGVLPVIGNLAYPAQLAWAAEHEHRLARFVIYDAFATIGRSLPIWGGPDTYTEHWFNRLPDRIARLIPLRRRAVDAPVVAPEQTG